MHPVHLIYCGVEELCSAFAIQTRILIDIVPFTYCAMNVMYVLIFLCMLFLLL